MILKGWKPRNFNPRSLTGATQDGQKMASRSPISIHAPSRERRNTTNKRASNRNFNPRSLTGATFFVANFRRGCGFQSTLPHGSDASALSANYNLGISIHAPSRERPQPSLADQTYADISIHAPSRERQVIKNK